MLTWLKRLTGPRALTRLQSVRRLPGWLRGRYDAATTTDNNARHWRAADGLSANAANSPDVRRILRNRARYEVANNSYARGIVLTLANDIVGTGPRLQMLTGDAAANRRIEQAFQQWARSVRLAERLRTIRQACAVDGESFAILTNNENRPDAIRLDLRVIEADLVTTPDLHLKPDDHVDGIRFDSYGNPTSYCVLREHPGELHGRLEPRCDRIPAASMIHLFRADRPGQARGIPELTPALPLFAMLRDYSLATLDAAKAAAYFAGIIYTDAPANGESDAVEPMDQIELERNALLTMPGGWKMSQLHAEHPSGTYSEFKREILNEIARCLNMPFNIAAANSAGYNYASGRLDHQTYFKSIRVEQSHLEAVVLDRILAAWLHEARLIPGLLPTGLRSPADGAHQWFWDGHEHVDPAKEANAQATRLASHTTTLADEYARRGLDWETQLRQRAKELTLMRDLGLSVAESLPRPEDEEDEPDDGETREEDVPTEA
ncbi:Phage portal protein, lambda family [Maioricimonas rarisocia]|uniref:Phage portal protein, lambda family n=1 Tax=Maioricimonas rarisocia TaxID=2528026 RepID=A0A517ZB14_9PLAN|nr:phage portal protein [Maioricimonas rarisocia]QDU39684.1 Phage portal protein, lambda family [Maioricimonas rarisocia]